MIDVKKIPLFTPEFKDEIESSPSTLTDELPLGILKDGQLIKKFKLVDTLSVAAVTHIHNKVLLQNNPARWYAMTISHLVDNFEGEPVNSEFVANSFKTIPNICLLLANTDASYILIYAHNEFYGSEVSYNDYACNSCGHKDVYPMLVDKFYVERTEVTLPIEVKLDKPIGNFSYQSSGREGIDPSLKFDRVFLTVPNLKSAIKHKDLYKPNSDKNDAFNIAVRMEHLVLGGEDGFAVDERTMFFLRNEIWNKISIKDQLKIHRSFEDLPRIYGAMRSDCSNCGSRVIVSLNFFSLIPETI